MPKAQVTEAGKSLITTGTRLFSAKQNYDLLNQELATWFYPERADFTQELVLGEEFADHLTNSTPTVFRRDLGNAFGTMMRPSGQDWFEMAVFDEALKDDVEARRFLEGMTNTTRNMLYARDGGFKRAAKEADHDFATFGCSVMSITNNKHRNGLVYQTWHLRDCAWAEGENNQIEHLHRKVKLTARRMEQLFGYDNLPSKVQTDLDNKKPETIHEIRHVAMPRGLYDATRRMPKSVPYISVYVTMDGAILQETPEPEFPYVVSRWGTISNWAYGISPATMTALPDARLVERMSLTLIEASEKATDPPLVATSEAINSPIDISSGAVTWVDSNYDERMGAPLVPLDLGKNVAVGDRLLDERTLQMSRTFFLDKLNLPQTGAKTAYEVGQLVQEYIRNALPLFEPMEDEVTGAQLDLTVAKGLRMGVYGAPEDFPEALQGQDIKFEFSNPLKEARDRVLINKFQETVQVLAAASEFDPSSVMNVNTNKMVRDVISVTAPAAWLKSEDEAAAEQAQDQADAKAQQELAVLQQAGQAVGDAANAGANVQQLFQNGAPA